VWLPRGPCGPNRGTRAAPTPVVPPRGCRLSRSPVGAAPVPRLGPQGPRNPSTCSRRRQPVAQTTLACPYSSNPANCLFFRRISTLIRLAACGQNRFYPIPLERKTCFAVPSPCTIIHQKPRCAILLRDVRRARRGGRCILTHPKFAPACSAALCGLSSALECPLCTNGVG